MCLPNLQTLAGISIQRSPPAGKSNAQCFQPMSLHLLSQPQPTDHQPTHQPSSQISAQYFWSGAPWDMVSRSYVAETLNAGLNGTQHTQHDVIAVREQQSRKCGRHTRNARVSPGSRHTAELGLMMYIKAQRATSRCVLRCVDCCFWPNVEAVNASAVNLIDVW